MKKTINKFYVTLLLLFVLLSCAQPKYIKNEGPSSPNSLQQEGQADCSLQLSSSKICVSWKWEVLPTASTMGSLILKTYRLNMFDQTALETDLESLPVLVLWMPSMGHGSTRTSTERLDTGTYRIQKVFFVMPGNWDLKFQVIKDAEIIDEATSSIVF